MQPTDTLSIIAASGRNAVSNTMLIASSIGEIIEVTEKAIKVRAETLNGKAIEAWFPKKAIQGIGSNVVPGSNSAHHTAKLAHWFRPTGWTDRFLELTTWSR